MADTSALAARMDTMEATVARLAASLDGMVDTIVARVVAAVDVPVVMTRSQLDATLESALARTHTAAKTVPPSALKQTSPVPCRMATASGSAVVRPPPLSGKSQATASPVAHVVAVPVSPPMSAQDSNLCHMDRVAVEPQQPTVRPYHVHNITPPSLVPGVATTTGGVSKRPVQPARSTASTTPTGAAGDNGDGRLYLWGNAWRHLPEDYEFPKESMDVMWRQWCCGDTLKGYKPLRSISASDIASANDRKRLSDLKFLMKYIENHLVETGVWKDAPTELEADQMLRAVRDQLPIAVTNNKGQKRELEGLKWHSAVTLLRGAINKRARTE